MKLPIGVKKCVAFVGLQMADQSFRMVGTVFFVMHTGSENSYLYAVTAKHVIEGVKSKGLTQVFFRINLKNEGSAWVPTNINDWIYHEDMNVDIAVIPISFTQAADHLFYPLSNTMTDQVIKENEIDVGDEVFVTGLFKHHHGTQKNIPVVRIGNICALPEEKIQTKEHLMDGYLIEARSIGGLSGSPVFVNLGSVRYINGGLVRATSGAMCFLMGLIYGHYDVRSSQIDSEVYEDATFESERVNTGIAIVTPITKLLEMFSQLKLIAHEQDVDEFIANQNSGNL